MHFTQIPPFYYTHRPLSLFHYYIIRTLRTRFDLYPKREWIQAHVAQTMNLQSAGKKASLILGQNIGFQCKKVKDTSVECSNKSLRTCPRDLISPFLLFSFLSPFFFCLSSPYIPWLFCLFNHPRVDLAFKVLFRHPPCPLLNLPFLAGKLFAHWSGITSTLMRPEGQLGDI